MPKLTLSFKDRKLKVIPVREQNVLIGRDPDCTVCIDSLAIEPRHVCIYQDEGNFLLEPAGETATVRVNDEPVSEATVLNEGDRIAIGKHQLVFSLQNEGTPADENVTRLPLAGWLQIQSGSHLGRTIRLDKAFTRIGKSDGDLAIIARRGDGYYVSGLRGDQAIAVNDRLIGDRTVPLKDSDRVRVGELQVQFFADAGEARQAAPANDGGDSPGQRRFSRVSFDVTVKLQGGEQRWDARLIDISLHGALVRTPETIHCDDGQLMLSIPLEGGPSICMDVEIAHRDGRETGLRCIDIDVDSITHLRRLVELNLGEPELLERELAALG